jgi:hypothetical protein
MVYLHVNKEARFWCSSGKTVIPVRKTQGWPQRNGYYLLIRREYHVFLNHELTLKAQLKNHALSRAV